MFNKFQEIVYDEWNIRIPDDLPLDIRLIDFAEMLSCQTEGLEPTDENVKKMYSLNIGHPSLHLPGLIAFTITLELGLNPHKVKSSETLETILNEKL